MLPKVNQILYMQIASSDQDESRIEYKSRIADDAGGRLLIEVPIDERTGRLKKLHIGDELAAYFITEGGVKHYFNTYVLGFREDAIRMIEIAMPDPESIAKRQRRDFLRVGASLELAVKLSAHARFLALTDDVGGGGLSFVASGKWPVAPGDTLDGWLLLPYRNGTVEHANFKSEVIRLEEQDTGRVRAMTKFIEITDNERQKIIRFCFERQLDYRKK